MAAAAGKTGDIDCEDCYLRSALMGSPKDPNCNRLYAQSLMKRGLIDQAITFWHRVEEGLPDNEEAKRAIASLTEQKARSSGKFDDDTSKKLKLKTQKQEELSLEKRLQQKIQNDPEKVAHYMELSSITSATIATERPKNCWPRRPSFPKTISTSGKNGTTANSAICGRKSRRRRTPTRQKSSAASISRRTWSSAKNGSRRFPNNLAFRFDLGCRYMKTKQFAEAIQEFQTAKNDPRRKGVCMLALGECFQQIEQYPLAKTHYEAAIQEIPDRDAENRKKAIYLLGRLAMFLKDLDTAEKHLNALASLDFTYKDVSLLLDKIRKIRENLKSSEDKPPEKKEDKPEGEGGSG